jgi:hypothetical protein
MPPLSRTAVAPVERVIFVVLLLLCLGYMWFRVASLA